MATNEKRPRKAKTATTNTAATTETNKSETKQKFRVKRDYDLKTIIPVRSGFQGILVYQNPRTKEEWVWERFGDEQDMTIEELRIVKNSNRAFFENNWLMIDDIDVLSFLGVDRYYKNALSVDEFDDLFTKTPSEIKATIAKLSNGQKSSVIYRAKELIAEDGIDSIKVINALEEALGVELIER